MSLGIDCGREPSGAACGIVGARDLVGVARAIPISLLVGSHRELGVGIAANLHLAAGYGVTLPAELAAVDTLEHTLLSEPLDVQQGRMGVPSGPGLGIELAIGFHGRS